MNEDKKIVSIKTLNGEVRSFDRSKLNEVEEVLVLRQHRAKPAFEKVVSRFLPGDKYKTSGLDKAEAIMSGFVSLDLNAKIPASKKRTVKDAEQSKIQNELIKNGYVNLQKQVDELTAMVKQLSQKK